jgi:hypothetical protein
MAFKCRYVILFLIPTLLAAQEKSEFQQILERLDRLEQENRDLAAEVRSLRAELAAAKPDPQAEEATAAPATLAQAPPAQPTIEERVAVQERRIEEQAQSKVEASQKFPISLTGMVLFNGFLNGKANNGQEDPTTASLSGATSNGGATLSQSVLGLLFQGPRIFGGGQINGNLYMDFFGGTTSSLNHLIRLRVASVEFNWAHTSLMVGQEKPIIAPREPNSLAQVGVSPLTGSGNLWLWSPQVRLEQRFSFGDQAGLRAQVGVYETSEPASATRLAEYASSVSPDRPGIEGRFEFWKQFSKGARIEIAPGFHESSTHVAGTAVGSSLATVDWLIQPVSKLQLTGMFFTGQNDAGVGGIRQGFSIFGDQPVGIGTSGGWAQFSILATQRLSFNLYGGQESDSPRDLLNGDIARNLTYAGNIIYRLGPNVLLGLEASQLRTNYFHLPRLFNDHYDLAVAYLF